MPCRPARVEFASIETHPTISPKRPSAIESEALWQSGHGQASNITLQRAKSRQRSRIEVRLRFNTAGDLAQLLLAVVRACRPDRTSGLVAELTTSLRRIGASGDRRRGIRRIGSCCVELHEYVEQTGRKGEEQQCDEHCASRAERPPKDTHEPVGHGASEETNVGCLSAGELPRASHRKSACRQERRKKKRSMGKYRT